MTGRIYLLGEDARLVAMEESPYDSEDLLQQLLASHPDLLSGDQMDAESPRRWLLIKREMAIPSEEEGGGRWSVDHLFLDQDGVPTLVEVKRSSDTRIRREVVGQMLDYAANAVVYWPVGEMRSTFEHDCRTRNIDPADVLSMFLEDANAVEEFWEQAKTNLQAGKIRMLFVADVIPFELRRIVEFLNEQLDPAEMLAVEVKQFTGQGMRTLVPRVIGQTAEAEKRKGAARREKRKWDEESFFAEMGKACDSAEIAIGRKLLDWAHTKKLRVWWGEGQTMGSFLVVYDDLDGKHRLFAVWTTGRFEFQFQHLLWIPPFATDEERKAVVKEFRSIRGIDLPEDAVTRRPSLPLKVLSDDTELRQFLTTFENVLNQIKGE
ncbi:hypothetical protein [Symmachiella dynata]|uniref:hypothetical protein n=1 Tax=Symmachiella dynata TaxID=2527995 RepID=UPI0030EE1AC4